MRAKASSRFRSQREASPQHGAARAECRRNEFRTGMENAAQLGDVTLSGRGGRLVELRPSILQAFDRFLADAMSGPDLLYKLARQPIAILVLFSIIAPGYPALGPDTVIE